MDLPDNIRQAVGRKVRGGLHQHTFVFSLAEMKDDANDTLDAFCDTHNVLSIVFNESKGNFIYVLIYKA